MSYVPTLYMFWDSKKLKLAWIYINPMNWNQEYRGCRGDGAVVSTVASEQEGSGMTEVILRCYSSVSQGTIVWLLCRTEMNRCKNTFKQNKCFSAAL